jgi:hypothetical protein
MYEPQKSETGRNYKLQIANLKYQNLQLQVRKLKLAAITNYKFQITKAGFLAPFGMTCQLLRCLSPTAYCFLPAPFCLLLSAYCFLPLKSLRPRERDLRCAYVKPG